MAFLPGIFNRTPAAPAAPAAPTVNANGSAGPASTQIAGPANPGAAPATMANAPAAPAVGTPTNIMDTYTNLFAPKPADPAAVKPLTLADPILGALDPATFRTQIANANFAAGIPQDRMQAALGGDVAAFAEVINMASREAFAAAAQLSHGLVEQGVRTGADRINGSMDSRIRNFQLKSQNTSNEALAHPAVAPMLNAVKQQIATSNPNLSPSDVQAQAEQYFTEMAQVLVAPKQAAADAATKKSEFDFSSYL